jgi:predicted AlkP superfamily phosphohydrolase/phosphomutase/tetratricopeptide (TPR) repeat protein
MLRGVLAVGVALLAVVVGTGATTSSSKPRVMVLGIDGADPEAIDLLISEGKLPNFARLRKGGAYGTLRSSEPMLSPILWTTIATGKPPAEHGIGGFVAVNPRTDEQLPVTSQMRHVQAIWNIASGAGQSVGVVGWWATWPAETVNGTIVSDHVCYHFLFDPGSAGHNQTIGLIYPPDREAEIAPLVRRPSDITPEEASRFVDVPAEEFNRPFDFKDDLSNFRWALATADSYRRIGLHLWRKERPDLLLTYIEGVDSTSHLFGHLFRATGLGGELAVQQRRYGKVVERMYEYADGIVGDFLAALDDSSTLVVLSDHGFKLGVLPDDPSMTRDPRRTSATFHRINGILYMYGRGIRRGATITGATQLDVTPTLLTLLGISPARDMPGRVLAEALVGAVPERTVASYEKGGSRTTEARAHDTHVDPAVLEHLRALGYLDADSPQGDRNMATMLLKAGRNDEAAEAYRKLIKTAPEDGELRTNYAAALAKLGRNDEALQQLDEAVRLAPANPMAQHNRGVILERQGKRDEAIKAYQTALRYNPGYKPSKQALARLGAPTGTGAPLTPAQRLAAHMAIRAKELAQHGNYDEAMHELDEAVRIAPDLPQTHIYRFNVAYLMGDFATARAALERALALEPDNAILRRNLERLDAKHPPGTNAEPSGEDHH